MEEFNSWALSVTFCVVLAGMTEIMVSGSKAEKSVRYVLGAFMLCAVVLPAAQAVRGISQITFPTVSEYSADDAIYNQQVDTVRTELTKLIEKTLGDDGISPADVSVEIDIDDSMEITDIHSSVRLFSADRDKRSRVIELIGGKLGIDAECTVLS